jgi:hypothetical protein
VTTTLTTPGAESLATDPSPRRGSDGPAPASARPWRGACLTALWVWLASHLAMVLLSVVARLPRGSSGGPLSRLLYDWQWGDSDHYVFLAQHGYGLKWEETAFFPVYPLLIRAFDAVVPGNGFVASLVVSSLAGYATLALMHRLTAYELGEEIAGRAVYYMAAFPLAFFLNIGFNTSVYLLAVLGALYCARRGVWWAAGLCAGVASGTRSAGVIVGLVLLYEYLRQRRWRLRAVRADVLFLGLAPSGLVAFTAFCWWKFGNPREYMSSQGYWGRRLGPPWEGFWLVLRHIRDFPALNDRTIHNLVDVGFGLAGVVLVALCLVGPWRLRGDQGYLKVYAVLALLVALMFPVHGLSPMLSTGRFVLEILPIFMVLAKIGANRRLEPLYVMPAIAMQAIWMALLLNNVGGD